MQGFWDRLVFAKIRKAIGLDRMRIMLTGASPPCVWLAGCPSWRVFLSVPSRPSSVLTLYVLPTTAHHPTNIPGSAPLAPHVLTFMRLLCACPIHEGYGQTETTAMTTVTFPGDWTTGHVGGVAPVCEVREGNRKGRRRPKTNKQTNPVESGRRLTLRPSLFLFPAH